MKLNEYIINNTTRTKISVTGNILVIPSDIDEHIELYSHPTNPYSSSFSARFDAQKGAVIDKGTELYAKSTEQTVTLFVIEKDAAD